MNLRNRLAPLLLAAMVCAPAFAAAPAMHPSVAKPQTAQQQRMATCSAQNKGKKGADYMTAQRACLKSEVAASSNVRTAQQQRMANCSAQNKGKKGADYKTAQSSCLKGGTAAPAKVETSQQERMAQCSALNKGKKGADFKAAQSACLKKN